MITVLIFVFFVSLASFFKSKYSKSQVTHPPGKEMTIKEIKMDSTLPPETKMFVCIFALDQPSRGFMVFSYQLAQEVKNNVPPKEFYWRDDAAYKGYGPFKSIYAAVEHYKYVLNGLNSVGGSIVNKLPIRVDFINKKRVDNAPQR